MHLEDLELLIDTNPRGGRPQKLGSTVHTTLEPKGSFMEVTEIKEDSSLRIFLGYCGCGKKIVAGERRILILMRFALSRMGIENFEELKERIKNVLIPYEKPKKSFWEDA